MYNNSGLSVSITGLHIDPTYCWLVASPDGLVKDPSEPENTDGLLEINLIPFIVESTCLIDISPCSNKGKSMICVFYPYILCKDKKH